VVKGQQWLTPKSSLAERFEGARLAYTQQQLEFIFSFTELNNGFNILLHYLAEHGPKLNSDAINSLLEFFKRQSSRRKVYCSHLYPI